MPGACSFFADIMLVFDRSGSVKNCFVSGAGSEQIDCATNPAMTQTDMYYFARDLVGGFELGNGTAQFGMVDFDETSRPILSGLTHDNATLWNELTLCKEDASCRAANPGCNVASGSGCSVYNYEKYGPRDTVQRADGWTSISNGLALGRKLLVKGNTRRDPLTGAAPERIMLLLTDGLQT